LLLSLIICLSLEDYTPSVDSAMESWNSSNLENRLSDHSETTTTTTKDIIVNDHQHYQAPNGTRSIPTDEKSLRPNPYDNYARFRMPPDSISLILKRDKRVLDFGFSISDRLYGTGVYVNKIRPNGPAELEGTLIPCMRIYKVISTKRNIIKFSFVFLLLSYKGQ